ncbi:MAG: methionyl-tRNA formyltransferase [Planctomycetota bacterium]
MDIAFLGTGDFAAPALQALVGAGHRIRVVISQPDRPAGRGRQVHATPVHAMADQLQLRHLQTADVNTLDHDDVFTGAELGVVAAFGQKIGGNLLAKLPHGCINIHGSLLPKYRGAAPYQWAVINGDTTTGVTIFQLNERWDAGPIWSQSEIPIGDTETADELHDRLARTGAELIVETLPSISAGTATPLRQDKSQASRAPKLSRADGVVDWTQPATRIARRINGLWSWPTATCLFVSRTSKRERLQLARAQVAEQEHMPTPDYPPGAVRADGTVQGGMGTVRLLEVKPAGKKLMPFTAFAHGRQVAPPDRLLPLESL